ncbi:MAG TPA: hypothetical protein VNA17_01395 [Pyrinomonadaceae bacterium]|nr:hypothetical protein [Pyrinomonadaceae bacterium]
MRSILILLVLAMVVMGCGRFGADGGTAGNSSANAKAVPAPVTKLVDLPALLGKSVDEMNTIIGQQQKESVGSVRYKLPKGHVYAGLDKDKKAVLVSFTFETQTAEGMSFSGYPTAEQLGQAVGLEIKGTPSPISKYEDKYYDFMVAGKKCELSVTKLLEAYNEAKLYCPEAAR